MAKKTKRADGLLQKGFRVNGKAYVVYGHSERELFEKMQAKLEQIEAGIQTRKNPTLNEYYKRWNEARKESVKETTISTQTMQFLTIADIYIPTAMSKLGEIRLKDISVDDLRLIQNELSNRMSTNSTNQYVNHVKHVLQDALKERLIDYNPCCMLKPLKRTEEQARDTSHRALTADEQKMFFESERCKASFYYNLFRFALCTGMRVGEIGALNLSDIHGDAIHISRTLTKDENGRFMLGKDAKTKAGQRQIPLNDTIRQILADQKAMNAMLDGNILSMDDLIFKSPKRCLLNPINVDIELAKVCKTIGLDHVSMHAFRATFATRAVEAGVLPKTLQELLGHNDIAVTMNVYAHATQDVKKQAMQAVEIAI